MAHALDLSIVRKPEKVIRLKEIRGLKFPVPVNRPTLWMTLKFAKNNLKGIWKTIKLASNVNPSVNDSKGLGDKDPETFNSHFATVGSHIKW